MTMASRIAVMKGGRLQQIDTPQRLYDLPVNVFVAGFIGSPAMNFMSGKLDRSDGNLVIDTGQFHLPVPGSRRAAFERLIGRPVILGIRPEDIHDPAFTPPQIAAAMVEVTVDVTELMGNEVFIYLSLGPGTFVGRVDPRTTFRPGGKVQVAFNMEHMHLFEVEGEQVAVR
jgi:multiple sugar transport system ATP-binding protein